MSNIPKANIMLNMALSLIVDALKLLPREKSLPRTPTRSRRMTKALAAGVRSYKGQHPDASLQEIGDHFLVNPGRVSEALNNKKKYRK